MVASSGSGDGEFLDASSYEAARAIAVEAGQVTPRIEVLASDMVRLDASNLRLDAIFRHSVDFLRARDSVTASSQASEVRRALSLLRTAVGSILAAADDEGDAETMTRARVRVIRLMRTYFERHWGSGSGGRFGMLQWDIRRFCASERSFIAKHAGRKFSAADEAAIRTLI